MLNFDLVPEEELNLDFLSKHLIYNEKRFS